MSLSPAPVSADYVAQRQVITGQEFRDSRRVCSKGRLSRIFATRYLPLGQAPMVKVVAQGDKGSMTCFLPTAAGAL